jgi:ATP-binding cassette, subfamily C (CFTR/MRP), member 1
MIDEDLIETICQAFVSIHQLWAVPVELGIALWLLERQLGLAFLAPTAVAMFAVRYLGIGFPHSKI